PFIELGNLDISLDFTGINDVVSAYLALIDSNIHGETLNLSSGVSISLREIIDELRQLSGHDLEVRSNPGFVRNTEIRTLCGDSGKLQN
ncbi:GDP-mannose 4,6 dehydratase, partial [Pseudomonas fragi]